MAFHAKIVNAGNEAVGAWSRMISLSCAQLTDGFITTAVANTIARKKILKKLVDVRLLDVVEGGYQIHDFLDWNLPSSDIIAKREADRKRKETSRKSQGRDAGGRITSNGILKLVRADNPPESADPPPVPIPSPVSRPHSQSPLPPEGAEATHAEYTGDESSVPELAAEPEAEPEPDRPSTFPVGLGGAAADEVCSAYASGISSATHRPFAFAHWRHRRELLTVVNEHLAGVPLLEGIERVRTIAHRYASTIDARFEKGYAPEKFAERLNSGVLTLATPAKRATLRKAAVEEAPASLEATADAANAILRALNGGGTSGVHPIADVANDRDDEASES